VLVLLRPSNPVIRRVKSYLGSLSSGRNLVFKNRSEGTCRETRVSTKETRRSIRVLDKRQEWKIHRNNRSGAGQKTGVEDPSEQQEWRADKSGIKYNEIHIWTSTARK
jgi:hypothetical protein